MMKKNSSKAVTMHGPAIYRIRVRGRLEASYSDRVGGMQITELRGANGAPETILVGRLADQAMLSGILNFLYDHHLPVLSAECVDTEDN